MKAVVYYSYGGPEVLKTGEISQPGIKDDEVLVKVMASGVNPVDWKIRKGNLKFITGKKFPKTPGMEISGIVEKCGNKVSKFKPGDAVVAMIRGGGCAAYKAIQEDLLVMKPPQLSFEEAASFPLAGITALLGLREQGNIQPGFKVLVNGASGGVGVFAIQIARLYECEVTAVCSSDNFDLVKSLGADHVIDYKTVDFTKQNQQYDIIFDAVATLSFMQCRDSLSVRGTYIKTVPRIVILFYQFLTGILPGKNARTFLARPGNKNLLWLCEKINEGKIRTVIDRVFTMDEASLAHSYSESGRVKGKIVIRIGE